VVVSKTVAAVVEAVLISLTAVVMLQVTAVTVQRTVMGFKKRYPTFYLILLVQVVINFV